MMTDQRHILCGLGLLLALLAPITDAGSPATAAGADQADTAYGRALALAAAHQGYVVQGKQVAVRVLQAITAYERCVAVHGPAAPCTAPREVVDRAEERLLRMGWRALRPQEPATHDPLYATAPVVVATQDGVSAVIAFLPPGVATPARLSQQASEPATSAAVAARTHGQDARAGADGSAQPPHGCTALWCDAYVFLSYTPPGARWALALTSLVSLSARCASGPHPVVRSGAWHVGGRAGPGQQWTNVRYTRSTSATQAWQWLRVYGTITMAHPDGTGPLWSKVTTLDVGMDCTGSHWTWHGATVDPGQ